MRSTTTSHPLVKVSSVSFDIKTSNCTRVAVTLAFVWVSSCMCVPGIAPHSGSSSPGSRGSSESPGHLGESHQLRLFLAAGTKGTSAPQTPQGKTAIHINPPNPSSYALHHSLLLLLSWSSTMTFTWPIMCYKTNIRHYVRAKGQFSCWKGFIFLPGASFGSTALYWALKPWSVFLSLVSKYTFRWLVSDTSGFGLV